MKRTPLYQHHIDAGGTMTEFAGYALPISYSSIRQEHKHVRESVGVFDVSHMGEIRIYGKDASAFMGRIFTGDLETAENNTCHYGFMCYEQGSVVDDIIVYKELPDRFMLVVNAANIDKDYEWIVLQAKQWDVALEQLSHAYGQLAIQGPKASMVVDALIPGSGKLKFFTFAWFADQEREAVYLVSRTGYTGEDGFEIIMKNNEVVPFYERLMTAFGDSVKPIGLGARDTLRFEACLPLYGHELSENISPVEAGLSRFLTNPNDYIGKNVHSQQKTTRTRRLKAYKLKEKGVPRSEYSVLNENQETIGYVTTGYLLEGYDTGRLLAYVDESHSCDEGLCVKIRNRCIGIEEIKKPFYKKKYKRSE